MVISVVNTCGYVRCEVNVVMSVMNVRGYVRCEHGYVRYDRTWLCPL